MNPFEAAIKAGNLSAVERLAEESGLDPIKVYPGLWPSILLAAKYGSLDIVKYLIQDKGVDPQTRSEGSDKSPILVAAEHGNLDIVRYLIEDHNIDPAEKNRFGKSALGEAEINKQHEVIEYLRNLHLKINTSH
jgi:ankyrin repeat protein